MSLLDIKDLRVRVEDREILRGVNLQMNAGEVHSIMGPNGSERALSRRCWRAARRTT